MKNKSDIVSRIQLVGDLLLLNIIFFVGSYINGFIVVSSERTLVQFLYLNLFWLISTTGLKAYVQTRVMRITTILNVLIKSFIFHLFLIFSFISFLKQPLRSGKFFILEYSIFVVLVILWRLFTTFLLKSIREKGYNYKRVIIAGSGKAANDIYNFFHKHPEYGYKCLGFFDDGKQHENRLGSLNDLEGFVLKNKVDEIYCILSEMKTGRVHELISFADNNIIRLKIVPDFRGIGNYMLEVSFFDKIPVLNIRDFPLDNSANRLLKRTFDIFFSLLVILFIFPWVFPIIALGIKLTSKGPIFFKQLRSGRGNKPFLCYKFRTMTVNEQAHELQAYKNDPRITPFGAFLRRTNLDELPQFFNVLIGNMSVVGPRPHMLLHTQKYSREIDKFMLRHFVMGGITGLAQVRGFRGETRELSQMRERLKLDVWYIENWSFYLDIKIIINTFASMVRNRNTGA